MTNSRIIDALMDVETAETRLRSLCRAARDTADSKTDGESDRTTINRMYELLTVLEHELDILQKAILDAEDVAMDESGRANMHCCQIRYKHSINTIWRLYDGEKED